MTNIIKLNEMASILKALHVPGDPLLLANVHDASSAALVASLPATKAIATASWAIAEVQGMKDTDLTLDANLQGIRYIVRGIQAAGKSNILPLSADLQDGYDDPAETIRQVIKLGVVGCNLEDMDNSLEPPTLRPIKEAANRIQQVTSAAREAGVPDFVVNARCDVLSSDSATLADIIDRGQAYLAAGASTVFVWGVNKRILTEADIRELVDAFQGRVAVFPGTHSIATLKSLGVSRISVGPTLWRTGQAAMKEQATSIVNGAYIP